VCEEQLRTAFADNSMVSTSGFEEGEQDLQEKEERERKMNQELTRHVQDRQLGNVVRNYLGSVAKMYIGKRQQKKSTTDRHSRG
jgi:hypothetical protein